VGSRVTHQFEGSMGQSGGAVRGVDIDSCQLPGDDGVMGGAGASEAMCRLGLRRGCSKGRERMAGGCHA
jgi:hypothetical protein